MKHARLGPSDSARWLACAGSINFTKDYPRSEHNFFTAEGTVAHSVREQCLKFGFTPYEFIGQTWKIGEFEIPIDEEMADHLMPGIDEILEFDGKLFVEEKIDTVESVGLDPDENRQFGTLDAGVVGTKLIVISDLKYGTGVAVSAVKNTQQIIYALNFWREIARHITDATDFLIIIDQPRNSDGGGYWHVTLDELLAFDAMIQDRAELTNDPLAPLTAGVKQCSWCPAANVPGRPGGCPAHHEWVAASVGMKFEDLDRLDPVGLDWEPPKIAGLTPERKTHISRVKSTVEKWLEKVHADCITDGLAGFETPGMKVVDGRRPKRKYRDLAVARTFLEQKLGPDKIFNKTLLSPKQAETAIGKKYELPEALVERGQPKPILVPVEDARPAKRTVSQKFDALDDEI